MKIKYKNFEIVIGENSYDLYYTRPRKLSHTHKKIGKEVKVCLGYFNALDSCIKRIIHIELSNRVEIVDLSHYIELLRNLKDEIFNTINRD